MSYGGDLKSIVMVNKSSRQKYDSGTQSGVVGMIVYLGIVHSPSVELKVACHASFVRWIKFPPSISYLNILGIRYLL